MGPRLLFWVLCNAEANGTPGTMSFGYYIDAYMALLFCYYCLNYLQIILKSIVYKKKRRAKWVSPLSALARKDQTGTEHYPFADKRIKKRCV